MDAIARHHAHMAKLTQLGEHWHQKLWYGSGPWDGDRFLNIYHHPLKDEIEVRYEVPNRPPELVFQIALADFDIDKLCHALAKGDSRKGASQAKMAAEVEDHNNRLRAEQDAAAQEKTDQTIERMQWAIKKDTGNHISPMTVPSVVPSGAS